MSARADGREMGMGGVLQGGEGLVLLETLREMLGSLGIEVIVAQTAKERQIVVSGGADSGEKGKRRRTRWR